MARSAHINLPDKALLSIKSTTYQHPPLHTPHPTHHPNQHVLDCLRTVLNISPRNRRRLTRQQPFSFGGPVHDVNTNPSDPTSQPSALNYNLTNPPQPEQPQTPGRGFRPPKAPAKQAERARLTPQTPNQRTEQMPRHTDEYVAKEPLIQLDIGVRVSEGWMTIDAIRDWWRLDVYKARTYHLVLGKVGRKIVGAYRPKPGSWTQREDGRWGFEPIIAADVWNDYVGKSVPDEYYGSRNPVRYIPPNR